MKLQGAEKFPSIWVSRELNTPAKDPTKEKSSKLTILPPAMCRGSWWPRGSWGRSRCRGCTAPRLSCPAGVFIMIHSRWWWLVVFLLFGDKNGPSSFIRNFYPPWVFRCLRSLHSWLSWTSQSLRCSWDAYFFFLSSMILSFWRTNVKERKKIMWITVGPSRVWNNDILYQESRWVYKNSWCFEASWEDALLVFSVTILINALHYNVKGR